MSVAWDSCYTIIGFQGIVFLWWGEGGGGQKGGYQKILIKKVFKVCFLESRMLSVKVIYRG